MVAAVGEVVVAVRAMEAAEMVAAAVMRLQWVGHSDGLLDS